jgi:hypothetical protein
MNTQNQSKVVPIAIGAVLGIVVGSAALWLIAVLFRPSKPATVDVPQPNTAPTAAPQQPVVQTPAAPTPRVEVHPSETPPPQPVAPTVAAELASDLSMPPEKVFEIQNKLKMIGIAFHNMNDVTRGRGDRRVSEGLSWRVQLLPFLEELPLYERFRLNEPWDSPHNLQLLAHMPDIYQSGDDNEQTHFLVFGGDRLLFQPGRPFSVRLARDGTSKTLLAVHTGAGKAVPWTKPDDLQFEPNSPLRGIGPINGRIEGVMLDISPISLPADVAPTTFAAIVTPASNELIDSSIFRASRDAIQSQAAAGSRRARGRLGADLMEFEQRIRNVGRAMHDAHNAQRQFPAAAGYMMLDGKPGPPISWRVILLPWMEEQALAKRYDRKAAWDSPANRELLQYMPENFAHPADKDTEKTRIQVFTGPGTPFEARVDEANQRPMGFNFRDLADGTSKTIMAVCTGADRAVPWTEPRDVVFDESKTLESLGTIDSKGIPVMMFDGSVRMVNPDVDPQVFKSMVLMNDGK